MLNGAVLNEPCEGSIISIRNLHKRFDTQEVLDGVDLDVASCESLVILGRSGCGKSVLLKHITGLISPDHGSITFEGEDITKFSRQKLFEMRKHFGMLFQGAALFDSMTVGENVGLPLVKHGHKAGEEIREIVLEKLRLIGLTDVFDSYPSQLSGGMKKRVGLARAIVMDPQVVLYDEPTTGLDPIMADVINSLIRDLQHELKITSVVVTHDINSAYRVADRMTMLHEGKIIYSGSPEETRETDNAIVRQFIEGRADGPVRAV
jgi:phospholipid/cholesterol/gamma-HCH transport system ATP-binding protein